MNRYARIDIVFEGKLHFVFVVYSRFINLGTFSI